MPTEMPYGSGLSANSGCRSALRSASSSRRARCTGQNASSADTPSCRVLPCAARPATSMRKVRAPAFAVMSRPLVGSVMTATSPRCPRRSVANAPRPPSSSLTTLCSASRRSVRTPERCSARATARLTAIPAFMSQAPRPCSTPLVMLAEKGCASGQLETSPTGTTSTCPWSTSAGPPSPDAVPTTPCPSSRGASLPGKSGSARSSSRSSAQTSTSSPASSSQPATRVLQVALGVGAGDARHPHQLDERGDELVLVEGVEHAALRGGGRSGGGVGPGHARHCMPGPGSDDG